MKQYLQLLRDIKEKGTKKPAARANMPGSTSLFGYQFRHKLSEGFPILTTKKVYWKGVVAELLWFLRGDTNVKSLIDDGVNIWNEDAYNYYVKIASANVASINPIMKKLDDGTYKMYLFDEFIEILKTTRKEQLPKIEGFVYYTLGDCGYQYGKVWRKLSGINVNKNDGNGQLAFGSTDQIYNLIQSLVKTPESRRHIVTAIDPLHDQDLALYWCHAMFQFNCRPLSFKERYDLYFNSGMRYYHPHYDNETTPKSEDEWIVLMDESKINVPKYYLDCQLYQRSADVVLGVPFNIASYSLLVHLLCELCNMVPGEFIHTFGDVHIYDNHIEAVEEQLSRTPTELPTLIINSEFWNPEKARYENITDLTPELLTRFFDSLELNDFWFQDYNPQSAIKAELSTGLKK